MNESASSACLVFTDLDGSLLDHHTYSYRDAQPLLQRLARLRIPVIPSTSKTRAEIVQLREELGNDHPFIVENGAAVFIPVNYFPRPPAGVRECDGFWVREFSAPRADWLRVLESLRAEFPDDFDHFYRAGVAGIMRMTGLPRALAVEANRREYSEPVKWLGGEDAREAFLARLQEAGASVLQGGRFLAVSGDCDKGRALCWLRDLYRQCGGGAHDLAIGDSGNDVAMLEAAGTALLVRSPVHDFPSLQRPEGVWKSNGYGPSGWAEGVARWLEESGCGRAVEDK